MTVTLTPEVPSTMTAAAIPLTFTLYQPALVFSPQQLQQVIEETIPKNLPDGHKNAIVGTTDTNGVRVVAGFTLGKDDNWSIQGAFVHSWGGGNEVGAQLLFSW